MVDSIYYGETDGV